MYLSKIKHNCALNIEQDAEGGLHDLAATSAKLAVSTPLTANTDDRMASVQMRGSKGTRYRKHPPGQQVTGSRRAERESHPTLKANEKLRYRVNFLLRRPGGPLNPGPVFPLGLAHWEEPAPD